MRSKNLSTKESVTFDLSKYTGIDKEKVLNNCVAPEIGLAIFESALNIYNHNQVMQVGLFAEIQNVKPN